jgi:GTPase SAR1 family protein
MSNNSTDKEDLIPINVVIAGSSAVGKTSLAKRLNEGKTRDRVDPSSHLLSKVAINLKICRVQDLLQMANMGRNVFKNTDVLILVHDISSR